MIFKFEVICGFSKKWGFTLNNCAEPLEHVHTCSILYIIRGVIARKCERARTARARYFKANLTLLLLSICLQDFIHFRKSLHVSLWFPWNVVNICCLKILTLKTLISELLNHIYIMNYEIWLILLKISRVGLIWRSKETKIDLINIHIQGRMWCVSFL